MKKLISLVLVLCMALSVAAVASAEDVVEIRVVRDTFNLPTVNEEQVQKVEDAINAYIADKINVKIDLVEYANGEYIDKANMDLVNKDVDLLWTASWMGTIGTNDLVPVNAVYDITDLLPGTKLYESMAAGQWEATKYNGRNYYVPVYKDNVESYSFIFPQAKVDKYGWDLSTVKTLADLEPMLEDMKNDGVKYPYLAQATALAHRWLIDSFDFFTADSSTNFFAVDRETNTVINTLETEEYIAFCKLMGSWAEKGYIHEDDYTKNVSVNEMTTQNWGVSYWTNVPVNDEADARYLQDTVCVRATESYAHSTSALGSCYAIAASCTEAEAKACIDFLGLMYTDSKLADMYTFGIEGEDFTYTQEEGQTIKHVTQNSEKYNHSMWESANATIVTPLANEPDNKASLYDTFNTEANTSCAAGFRFDRSPVAAEYSACQGLFEQYGFPLETGAIAADDVESVIEAYQAELDAAGYQTVLAEFSRQYEAWKAGN